MHSVFGEIFLTANGTALWLSVILLINEIRKKLSVTNWQFDASEYITLAAAVLLVFSLSANTFDSVRGAGNASNGANNNGPINIDINGDPQGSAYAIYATRMFAGPGQYPPRQFKAYGIVAFKGGPTESEKKRFEIICDSYAKAITFYKSKQAAPLELQMITVWPVETDAIASKINTMKQEEVCSTAIAKYNISMAQTAIIDAQKNNVSLEGRGPFLLAWAPGEDKGKSDKLVLAADLSKVDTDQEANQFFYMWRDRITKNSSLWYPQWDIKLLKLEATLWLNYWGRKALIFFGSDKEKEK